MLRFSKEKAVVNIVANKIPIEGLFLVNFHFLRPEREGIEPSEILYFTVVMSFSPSLKAL